MKTFLAIGNEQIEEEIIGIEELEIIDSEEDLEQVYNLLEFIDLDFIIINRLLISGSDTLLKVVQAAKAKDIKVIMLIENFKDPEEKKLIAKLVSEDVYSFVKFDEIKSKLLDKMKNYPLEFDFNLLNDKKVIVPKKPSKNPKTEEEEPESLDTVIIEKQIEREIKVEVVNNAIVAIISNEETGKSWLSWNLSHCLARQGYRTALINIDDGYSANSYFGIDKSAKSAIGEIIKNEKCDISAIEENAYRLNSNLTVYTNELLSKEEVNSETFIELLNVVHSSSDVVLIDCKSEINDVLKTAVTYSNIVLFVFDMDNMHFNFNKEMINSLKNLNFKKTIAVINNAFMESYELENTKKFIKKLDRGFKSIVTIRNAGVATYNAMHSDSCAYFETEDEGFKNDINNLMEIMQTSTLGRRDSIVSKLTRFLKRKV